MPDHRDVQTGTDRAAKADLSRRSGADTDVAAKAERRLAWLLVGLYPPWFRRDVGLALVDALEDRIRARRSAGASTARAWLAAAFDTLRNAPAEWIGGRDRYSAQPPHKGTTVIDKVMQDVRYALRLWRRRPGFALVAIVTLALGVGANTAMFTIVNAVLLRPLQYAHADRLVSIWGRTSAYPRGLVSYDEYEAIRAQTDTFEAAALWYPQSVNLTGVDEPQRLVGSFVSGSFFDVLGLAAERGRLFTDEESAPGTVKPVVVLAHQTWQRRFNSDPAAIGATMNLNGVPLTVVGVLAQPFDPQAAPADGFLSGIDVFIPTALFPTPNGLRAAGPVMLGIARLRSGVTIGRAGAEVEVLRRRLASTDARPQATQTASFVAQGGRTLDVEPAQEGIVGSSRPALLLLFAAVGVVLLIACVNVSQLLLARAVDREKEIALRAALGASRGAVARQLVVEAGLMAVTSAVAGLLVGRLALASLAWLRPPASVPVPADLALDGTVLLFSGLIAIVVAMLCGLAPAVKTARPDLGHVLQAGFRRASAPGRRTRDLFMVVEMALSVALVAVAALLVESLLAVQRAPLGFDASNVFTLQFRLPQSKYPKPDDIARFFKTAIARVRAVPGVESAALVRAVPLSGNGGTIGYEIVGKPPVDPKSLPQSYFHLVTPDYFRTLRIPLLQGRDFTDRDDLQSPLVTVVNETFARKAFPGEDAIGKRITTPQTRGPITIVGVVGDAKHYLATEPQAPQIYAAHYQVPLIFCSLVARTKGPAMSLTQDVRKAIWSVDKDQPVWSVISLEDTVARTQGQSRFLAMLLAVFAAVALVLAGVGTYGVTSYGVAQRTHEIGIRLALGASGERVLREVVGRSARLALAGAVMGVVVAIAMARLASAVLFAVKPTDPLALAAAVATLMIVALAACYLPARRAARVDPVVALAEE
ncbi:MAG TPA: ABC transporter permease [Vicinamibacterales bacterium]|nr:ABC transporter permease [Vicinamibacterales bacterium]